MTQIRDTKISTRNTINEYIDKADWRIKANSNTGYSNAGLVNQTAGKVIANYWLDQVYSKEEGEAHRNGDIHIHDLDCLTGYCAGWSLRVLLDEGFNGVEGRNSSKPPKHFKEALGQMANFLGILQNEWAGAQAFSSFDTYLAPLLFRDQLSYSETKKAIKSFIYNLNVPARWGQSPFTNVTIDWTVPKDLQSQIPTREQIHVFSDILPSNPLHNELLYKLQRRNSKIEKLTDSTYKDFQQEVDIIDQAYFEVMTEGDWLGNPFTFPIPTVNITEDFNFEISSPKAKALWENTSKIGSSYFQNFIGSQYITDSQGNLVPNPEAYKPDAVRSMCPLTPDTELLVKSSKGITKLPISTLVKNLTTRDTIYKVWTGFEWEECRPVKTPKTKVYQITLSNGDIVKMGEDHLQPVKDQGTLSAKNLSVGMWLPYNKSEITDNSLQGSSELGFVIGAYLGDGSRDNKGINYSLDMREKDDKTEETIKAFFENLGYRVSKIVKNGCRSIRIGGNSFSVIKRFITGTTALDKGIHSSVFNMNPEFRKGIIDGIVATDGARDRKCIYSSSKQLINDLKELFSSLGQKALISSEDNRTNRLGNNTNYCLSYPQRPNYSSFYQSDNNYNYYRIVDIQEVEYSEDSLYCIEVANEEHLFALANGLITHNCRLQLDLRELLKRGGGLFGSAEMTGSIGVVTINMARIGYEQKTIEDVYNKIDYLCDIAYSTLEKKRVFVQAMYDRGLYPYTARYLKHFNNHFSTIGVNGLNEMCLNFIGKDIASKEGSTLSLQILEHIREKMVHYQEKSGNLYNLEATPAEGTTYRFAKEDYKKFSGKIIQSGTYPNIYYSNSSQLPAGYTDDPFEALALQDDLQCKYTGGTVLHLYMDGAVKTPKACRDLVQKTITNFKLPYITVTPLFSVCPVHGYLSGEHEFCPKCDTDIIESYKEANK